ncbi:N-acetyltransferase B complex non catalytic subunit-domain-containing protein [Pyronema omphalodes]|nr:N-acetyltransferase B complex non catalytic subunit-domain-containing protein [Pyronema omphalodes]
MSTADNRKNQLVWEQLELGAPKQALQLCNRRLKKGEKSESLLVLKAFVLTNISTPAATEEALQIARSLSDRTPPTQSIDTLRLLSRVWSNLGPAYAEEGTKLWDRAVKSQPQNEELAKEWFWGMVRVLDWQGAQKAAMNLQKTYPKRREYFFWAVVSCLLLHNSLPVDSPQRKMFGTLAYRMIAKARDDTPADTSTIPAKAIQTSQEVNLLLELLPYVAPGDAAKESLDVLNSKNLGVDSVIGRSDWWGLARKRLDLLEETKDWRALFNSCGSLLPKPEDAVVAEGNGEAKKEDGAAPPAQGRGDDWRVWDGFVTSAGKLYDDGDKSVAKESLDKILAHRKTLPTGSSRHGDLALVKFASLFHDKNDGPEGTPTLLEALQEYFVNTGNKSCTFEDTQKYLEMLEDCEKMDFIKFVEGKLQSLPEETEKQKVDKVAYTINYYKLFYLLTISPLSTASDATTKTISAFVTDTLNVYVSALSLGSSLLVTDDQYGDDAALLCVMGLVRLYTLSPSNQAPLYQSIHILEILLKKSKHNYQALLILVRLYLLIGAVGCAFDVYPRLNIKQVQNDTLAHYLLTRVSSLLPTDARSAALLRDAGGIYESSRVQTPKMLQLAFEKGGYSRMMGFIEFSERIEGSVCRSMWEIELRRLARLSPGYPEDVEVTEVGYKDTVSDNRDFAVVVDCDSSAVGPFEKSFRPGPTPGENWIRAFNAAEKVLQLLVNAKENNGSLGENVNAGNEFSTKITSALENGEAAKEFTSAEMTYLALVKAIAELVSAAAAKDGAKVATILDDINNTLYSKTLEGMGTETPAWSLLHSLWMAKDAAAVCELLGGFLGIVKGLKPAVPKPSINSLLEAAKKRRKDVVAQAEAAQKLLEDEDATQILVDSVLLEEGVGSILRKDGGVFGGVESVAENVKRLRDSIVRCFQSL